jgi:hypothetical protein
VEIAMIGQNVQPVTKNAINVKNLDIGLKFVDLIKQIPQQQRQGANYQNRRQTN